MKTTRAWSLAKDPTVLGRQPSSSPTPSPRHRSGGGWVTSCLVAAAGVATLGASAGCSRFDAPEFSSTEWDRLKTLTVWNDSDPEILRGIGLPPVDRSNRLTSSNPTNPDVGNGYPMTADGVLMPGPALGKLFFFDARFSGASTGGDWLGRTRPANMRVPSGQPTNLACVSCHDLNRAASDPLAAAISIGAGSIAANAPALANAPFFTLYHWNGRFDSLWAQALVVTEAGIVQNATRLEVAWNMWRYYRDKYQALFGEPVFGVDASIIAALDARIIRDGATAGQCTTTTAGTCVDGCVAVPGAGGCWPRFPLAGTATTRAVGDACLNPLETSAGCCVHPATTPYNCMAASDQTAVITAFVRFSKAVGAFEQTLASGNSAFDRFVHEGPNSTELSPAAKRGARLFVSKASCLDCHNTPLFSNTFFYNVGVATTSPLEITTSDCPAGNPACDCVSADRAASTCLPWGALTGLELLRGFPLRRNSAASDTPTDPSVSDYLVSHLARFSAGPPDETGVPNPLPPQIKWTWKTPSLRNVALTAPYMHNGRYATLAEVVDHYNRGGDPQAPGNPSALIKPLVLTSDEQEDLVAFLKSLTSAPWPDAIASTPSLPGAVP